MLARRANANQLRVLAQQALKSAKIAFNDRVRRLFKSRDWRCRVRHVLNMLRQSRPAFKAAGPRDDELRLRESSSLCQLAAGKLLDVAHPMLDRHRHLRCYLQFA